MTVKYYFSFVSICSSQLDQLCETFIKQTYRANFLVKCKQLEYFSTRLYNAT